MRLPLACLMLLAGCSSSEPPTTSTVEAETEEVAPDADRPTVWPTSPSNENFAERVHADDVLKRIQDHMAQLAMEQLKNPPPKPPQGPGSWTDAQLDDWVDRNLNGTRDDTDAWFRAHE